MTYEEMYQAFKDNKITLEEWRDYCHDRLFDLLEENKEVFIRLKDR
jgi:hypothetical protein